MMTKDIQLKMFILLYNVIEIDNKNTIKSWQHVICSSTRSNIPHLITFDKSCYVFCFTILHAYAPNISLV